MRIDQIQHTANSKTVSFEDGYLNVRITNVKKLQEDEWWTLGQHYGLATPLLDWTRSYWVAMYFAFCDSQAMCSTRAVYTADLSAIFGRSASLHNEVQLVDPESQDNLQLTSQSGLLLKLSIARSLEEWVQEHFQGDDRVVLTKIMIPNEDIEYCLPDLNRMNINHLSLFPDLTGAAAYANTVFRVGGMVDTGIAKQGT